MSEAAARNAASEGGRKAPVYLDWAATAPLCKEAARAMEPFQVPGPANLAVGANPNSLHSPGRAAFAALEEARRQVARAVGAQRPSEIVFTSGATEADNAAVLGIVAAACAERRRRAGNAAFVPHLIVSAIEHEAVLAPARALERLGCAVTRLAPNRQGFVEVRALEEALTPDTVLVSIQAANGEVGAIQPVAELAAVAHASGALVHTDAVQALGKAPVDVGEWGVDAASFSAHKIGGPKGVGALYLRARTPFEPLLTGGGQEAGRRSGTQNVAGAAGFAAACRAVCADREREAARQRALRDRLYSALAGFDRVEATVDVAPGSEDFLPNIVHLLVRGLESETLVLRYDLQGIAVSGGSACSSHDLEPSHVLRAMGISADRAAGSLRISLGRGTSEADIEALIAATPGVLEGGRA